MPRTRTRTGLLASLCACLCAWLCACLGVSACSRTRPPISAADEHFRVVVDYEDDRLPAPALAAVTPVWAEVAALWGVDPTTPDAPLDIHLYLHPGGYDDADARLSGGTRARNRAFAHPASLSAHVDLQPRVDPALIPLHGLPPQTERMLAHEAAHLARYALVPDHAQHAKWAVNGSALEIAARVMYARGRDGPVDDAPFTSTLMTLARRLASERRCPPLTAIVADELSLDPVDDQALTPIQAYAVQWAAWRFLITREDHVFRPPLGPNAFEALNATLRATSDSANEADAAFASWLVRPFPPLPPLPPRHAPWIEEGRGLATGDRDWQQCAFDSASAVAWHLDPLPPPYIIAGSVGFVTNGETAADVRLSSRGTARMLVRLWPLPGGARTRVSLRDDVTGAEVAHVLVDTRERFPFSVRVEATRITVTIADTETLEAPTAVPLDGPWGLAVSPGGWCSWRDIVVDP